MKSKAHTGTQFESSTESKGFPIKSPAVPSLFKVKPQLKFKDIGDLQVEPNWGWVASSTASRAKFSITDQALLELDPSGGRTGPELRFPYRMISHFARESSSLLLWASRLTKRQLLPKIKQKARKENNQNRENLKFSWNWKFISFSFKV